MQSTSTFRIFCLLGIAFILTVLPVTNALAQLYPLPEGTPLPSDARSIELPAGRTLHSHLARIVTNGLPNIVLTGYWPPTNEMLRQFSTDPTQNTGGWAGEDWEGRGYNIYSFFPEFPHGLGKGEGDFEVDYQDTSSDFWYVVEALDPIAIITFGRALQNRDWEIEWRKRNLDEPDWYNDYLSPYGPTPCPPDDSVPAYTIRYSSLPMNRIAADVNDAGLNINAFVDRTGDAGAFLCEYVGYHATWYHDLHKHPSDPHRNRTSGHIHVGSQIGVGDATSATEVTVRALTDHLNSSPSHHVPPQPLASGRAAGSASR